MARTVLSPLFISLNVENVTTSLIVNIACFKNHDRISVDMIMIVGDDFYINNYVFAVIM